MKTEHDYKPGKVPEALIYTENVLTGVSLCDGNYNFYIPVCEENEKKIVQQLKDFFSTVERQVAHNWVFDASVFHKYGIDVATIKLFDTQSAAHLLDENQQKGLKKLAAKYLGVEGEAFDPDLNHYSKTFFDYGLNDTEYTWRLYELFLPKIIEQKLDKLFFNTIMPWQRVLLEMRITGVQVNTKLLRQQREKLREKLVYLEQQLYDLVGVKYSLQVSLNPSIPPEVKGPINWSSPDQMVELFQKKGIEITEFTPKGKPSVGVATLRANQHIPFVKMLLRYRKAKKLYDSYLSEKGQIAQNVEKDGRVRTNLKDNGTATGRLSSSSPNMQQLSNPTCLECLGGDFTNGVCDDCGTLYEFNVRSVMEAPAGYTMFSCDYSGQEVYTMAQLCRDVTLIKMLELGQDQHFVNAKAVFKLDIPDEYLVKSHPMYKETKAKYGSYRKKGKIFSFGVPYGMGAHKAMNDFQVSEEEAEEMINNLWESFPDLKKAIDKTHEEVNSKYEVSSLVGRKRHFGEDFKLVRLKNKDISKYDSEVLRMIKQGAAERQSFNFKIQGTCADMIRMAGVNVMKKREDKWGLTPVLTVHDEVVFIVKSGYVEEATECVRKCFEVVTKNFVVPIPVDIESGRNYGESK